MGSLKSKVAIQAALADKDVQAWAKAKNAETPNSFNLGSRGVWDSKMYTPLRSYGATFANPEGLEAAYKQDLGSFFDMLQQSEKSGA